jgi:hypothetical protein
MIWALFFCLLLYYSTEWMVFLFNYFKDDLDSVTFNPNRWTANQFGFYQNALNHPPQGSFYICGKKGDRVNWKLDGF